MVHFNIIGVHHLSRERTILMSIVEQILLRGLRYQIFYDQHARKTVVFHRRLKHDHFFVERVDDRKGLNL